MGFVTACPTNETEVFKASTRLGCGNDKYGNNQYVCAPNAAITSLVETCVNGIMGIQPKGKFYKIVKKKKIIESKKICNITC